MNKLRIFNEEIFNKCMKLENKEELACPNLVSSKEFLNVVKEHPILYLGQETYCWYNNTKDNPKNFDVLEDEYDNFMINKGTAKTIFWKFLKDSTNIDYSEMHKNIVWTNTLLMGKRYESGTPRVSDDLKDISLKYLLFLYEYFKPSSIISVAGNRNPYYDITNKFLKEINSSLYNNWPNTNNSLLIDKDKNIFWTYHPVYLNRSGLYNENVNKIYKKIK